MWRSLRDMAWSAVYLEPVSFRYDPGIKEAMTDRVKHTRLQTHSYEGDDSRFEVAKPGFS